MVNGPVVDLSLLRKGGGRKCRGWSSEKAEKRYAWVLAPSYLGRQSECLEDVRSVDRSEIAV